MSTDLEIIDFLTRLFRDFEEELSYHKKLNQPFDPIGDTKNEMLHAIMYNTRCKGSAGSGWDTKDKGESKYANYLQYRKCQNCDESVMFFLDECPECGGKSFKESPKDARWGIAAKTHLKYYDDITGYRLTLLEPFTYEPTCRIFNLRSWFIDTKNEYLTEYANNQVKTTSNNINFQPLKRDFYLSSPCKHLDVTINAQNNECVINFYDINNNVPEPIPDKYNKEETIQQIMENKKFGKERGYVSRN
jgi:rRNA maturation protein Nop10